MAISGCALLSWPEAGLNRVKHQRTHEDDDTSETLICQFPFLSSKILY